MKTSIINPFTRLGVALTRSRVLPALIVGLGLIPVGRVTGQTFTVLHTFTYDDGANPQAALIISGNTLYGTATYGGGSDNGTVFAVNTDGTGFRTLRSFTANSGASPYTNSDGAHPLAGLVLSGDTLYGTTYYGGSSGNGTVFAINTDGRGFTNLHSFTGGDGANPSAEMVLFGSTLYGTTVLAGFSAGYGTVFAVNTNGTGFTTLHSFNGSDGGYPNAGLILSGNTLYGMAGGDGPAGYGSVFALNTNGTGFTNVHNFTPTFTNSSGVYTNSDGAYPWAGLILSGNTLYGTASQGGSSGNGTLFAVNTDGTGFTNLHSLTGSDGAYPNGLILSGNTLYGMASQGGSSGRGTAFAVNTDGVGFTNLHSFTATSCHNCPNSDGAYPVRGLVLSGNTLYGMASQGGSSGNGTVFSLSFRPQLTITSSGVPPSGIILSWPTNVAGFDYTGFTLQSTTDLGSPAVWSTNSPAPVVIAGQNTVTNPITGAQQFYRLIQ